MKIMPKWTTVVSPDEYDIEDQLKRMVKRSNKNKEVYTAMDIGQIVGLYLDWKKSKKLLKKRV